jgi:thiosulfate/3-mercaptopyruvate sulfurtransferase
MTSIAERGYANPDVLVDTQWVADHLNDPNIRIVESNEDPLLYSSGHIPGAVNVPFSGSEELSDQIRNADEIVVYCGSGITACVDLLALVEAGRPDAKLYPGSWSDWASRGLPVETGP